MPAAAAGRTEPDPVYESIREADMQLARLGYRLATANAALCDRLQPATGIQFHSLTAYSPKDRLAARSAFRFDTDMAVEGVINGSPATRAGVRADDSLLSIQGLAIDTRLPNREDETTNRLAALVAAIARLPAEAPITFVLKRAGVETVATVAPVPACLTRFEVNLADGYSAVSDDNLVQIGSRFLRDYGDDAVAIVAHELAHNILRHRARLDAAGVDGGLLSSLGANVGLIRRAEIEADILAVYLLANAGYDPSTVPAFWRRLGKEHGSFLSARTHPKWKDRAATIAKAVAAIRSHPERPTWPDFLAQRNGALSRNWRELLVRD